MAQHSGGGGGGGSSVRYFWPIGKKYTSAGSYGRGGAHWANGHTGMDMSAPSGTKVWAAQSGTVVRAGWYGAYGNTVTIRHSDGTYSQYSHLSSITTKVGRRVSGGLQIGRVGSTGNSTGPHLHFEVRKGSDRYGNDINPYTWMTRSGNSVGTPSGAAPGSPAGGGDNQSGRGGGGAGQTPGSGAASSGLNSAQRAVANTIIRVGRELGVSTRGIRIALMTALVESEMKNVRGGHLDSVGVFQQRKDWANPNKPGQRNNVAEAARMFYTGGYKGQPGLLDIKGWQTMNMGAAAQAVQRSAFPGRYITRQAEAVRILQALGPGAGVAGDAGLGDADGDVPGSGGGGGGGGGGGRKTVIVSDQNGNLIHKEITVADTRPEISDYGYSAAFLAANPEIKNLVNSAVKNEWTISKFEYALKQTKWYKRKSESQRAWSVLTKADPAEAKKRRTDMADQVRSAAKTMGVTLTDWQVDTLSEQFLSNAFTPQQQQEAIAARFGMPKDPGNLRGNAARAVTDLRGMAQSYGVGLSTPVLTGWAQDILAGTADVDGFRQYMIDAARAKYTGFADDINESTTTSQLFDPYRQMAAETLGINAETIQLDEAKWQRAMTHRPGGAKAAEPMNLDQWGQSLRTDTTYGFDRSQNAKSMAYDLSKAIAEDFGHRA